MTVQRRTVPEITVLAMTDVQRRTVPEITVLAMTVQRRTVPEITVLGGQYRRLLYWEDSTGD